MTDAEEIYADHTYTTNEPEALGLVFDRLPDACKRVILEAARTPGKWLPYDVLEQRVGLAPGTFKSSLGGYRSHDADRPRPFHIGRQQRSGRFTLMVDEVQAEALLGRPEGP